MISFDNSKPIFNPKPFKGAQGVESAIFVFDDAHFARILSAHPHEDLVNDYGEPLGSPKIVVIDGERLFITDGGTGGAAAAMEVEKMIASGVKNIVAFGTAGALSKDIPTGSVILPTAAFRDEGASYHYLPGSEEIAQSDASIALLESEFSSNQIKFLKGKTWTTDAIYRETVGKRELYKQKGGLCVEMECASLLAVAKYRGVNFAQFLIILDNIDDNVPKTDYSLYQKLYDDNYFNIALNIIQQMKANYK
ncbi:MAG: nucleoside phosphorylase [Candidatus Nomurabacteria bacterium]|jgi:uridine phosphorylase|nr:nucleoside phosphorylase [Candidatus Nomurabacteria bacterium]